MSTLADAFATGQEAAIRASGSLPAVMGLSTARLYTGEVPNNAPLPYIVTGEDQILGDDTECAEGAEIASTVHVWGMDAAVVRRIIGALKPILKTAITVADYVIDDWELETETYSTDQDHSTHGRLVIRYLATSTAD